MKAVIKRSESRVAAGTFRALKLGFLKRLAGKISRHATLRRCFNKILTKRRQVVIGCELERISVLKY